MKDFSTCKTTRHSELISESHHRRAPVILNFFQNPNKRANIVYENLNRGSGAVILYECLVQHILIRLKFGIPDNFHQYL